jgi:ABC-2 type transport system permease protein
MVPSLFKGTGTLIRLMLKQERFKITMWLLGLLAITLATAATYPSAFPDTASQQAYALITENPAMKAMIGIGYEMEDMSVGAVFAIEMLLFSAIAVAVMNILIISKSTRADEEEGRAEVIRSLPVGRLSYLSAAIIVMIITDMVLAVLTGMGLTALDSQSYSLQSSFLYGAILGVTGLIFAAIAAVFAQLSQTSRGTIGYSFAILILSYIVRAIGDAGNETLSLFSPLGLILRANVFAGNHWQPVIVLVCIIIILFAVAFYLNSIRDIGSGFLPDSKGKTHASPFLQTPFGLAFRLQRTTIISWTISVFAICVAFGFVLKDLETYFADNEYVQSVMALDPSISLTDQFLTLLVGIISITSVIPAVMVVLKLKGEEKRNRTEHFFSRAVSRTHLITTYTLLALFISLVMGFINALGLWASGNSVLKEPIDFMEILSTVYVYLPALWAVVGLTVLLIGAAPKLTSFVWLYVVYCFVVLYLKETLDLPETLVNLSVFEHIPQLLTDELRILPLIILTGLFMITFTIGVIGYNKRDITG